MQSLNMKTKHDKTIAWLRLINYKHTHAHNSWMNRRHIRMRMQIRPAFFNIRTVKNENLVFSTRPGRLFTVDCDLSEDVCDRVQFPTDHKQRVRRDRIQISWDKQISSNFKTFNFLKSKIFHNVQDLRSRCKTGNHNHRSLWKCRHFSITHKW